MVARKKPQTKAAAEPALYVGAPVIPGGSSSVFEITRISDNGTQVDLCLRGTPSSNAWMSSLAAASMPTSPMTST
jgi:hypothetical protein